MKRPAFSLLAFLLAATPALADAPYRDARLAGYLVGSWFHDETRPNTVLSYDRNFTPDGQFTGTIIAIRSAGDGTTTLARLHYSGHWKVEGDTLVETIESSQPPTEQLPTTDKVHIEVADNTHYTGTDLTERGTRRTFERLPPATPAHIERAKAPWPEPGPDRKWVEMSREPAGVTSYDASTLSWTGSIGGVWLRTRMSDGAVANAQKKARTGKGAATVIKGTESYLLFDCDKPLIRTQETRITLADGQTLTVSKASRDDLAQWERRRDRIERSTGGLLWLCSRRPDPAPATPGR